jgi:hypothetical protein
LQTQEQTRYLQESVTAANRTVEITNEQYSQGAIDFTPVFLFESTLTDQQDQLAAAQGDVALALIAVYRALGGGWQIRLGEGMDSPPNMDLPALNEIPPQEPMDSDIQFQSYLADEAFRPLDVAGSRQNSAVPIPTVAASGDESGGR